MAKSIRGVLVLAVVILFVSSMFVSPAEAGGRHDHERPNYPIPSIWDGFGRWLTAPQSMPAGANVPGCRPSRAHPIPVVLVHGTIENAAFNWAALSPRLANEGFCVFAFNYGKNDYLPEYLSAMTDIASSAAELRTFIDSVLQATGSKQVDIVGHSQGGMMPRYYLKHLGGASKVHTLVALSPSNHGTTFLGLTTLILGFKLSGVPISSVLGCVSCTQQFLPSSFIDALNAGGETVPGVNYVVIQTRYDEIVTPYASAFLSGSNVRNILLQDQCPQDYSEHGGIAYDPMAAQNVIEALGRNRPEFQPTCSLFVTGFFG